MFATTSAVLLVSPTRMDTARLRAPTSESAKIPSVVKLIATKRSGAMTDDGSDMASFAKTTHRYQSGFDIMTLVEPTGQRNVRAARTKYCDGLDMWVGVGAFQGTTERLVPWKVNTARCRPW